MTTVLRNVVRPGEPDRPLDVVIEGETIAAVREAGTAASGDVLDATGLVVSPGLIDTHVHLLEEKELSQLTDAGVTTCVELGTQPDALVERLRAAPGVTSVVSAGSAASAPGSMQVEVLGFPEESAVTGPEDAERFVQWRQDSGADLVKIIVEDPHIPDVKALAPETLAALVRAAHERGLLTVAHVVTSHAYGMGLDAGVDVLTHAPLDQPVAEETAARMVEAGTVASPTLTMLELAAKALAGRPGPTLTYDAARETVRRLHAAGVPVVAGTDANQHPHTPAQIPHGSSLHHELELLVAAGLTPAEALDAATTAAARVFRLTDRGSLEPGLRADLVLFGADPARDITASRDVRQVWIGGERVR
ncbi:amidohydrolase family protein [Kocuria sp.]|uniref:amidohydrolase family protein n=1 Tax=Kocuria sp. TaxID=1871328 RepID=UPI0026DB746B|nr:amidohydrolase family protein [Kocuria sp.]MDO4918909.1 amidohydrolase family protein [Kocuria sp.]